MATTMQIIRRGFIIKHQCMVLIDSSCRFVEDYLKLLERPIKTVSKTGRTWYGYSPYNPVMIIKLLDIFRAYYNYCLTGGGKQAPAMRLGLAKGPVSEEDIIYF